ENLAAAGWPHQVASRVKTMPLYWLVYRHDNQISVVIEPGASLIHARMRASLDGLDQGDFTQGHQLDRKWRVQEHMVGRRLSQEEAKRRLSPHEIVRLGTVYL